jgi:hypothetical protein
MKSVPPITSARAVERFRAGAAVERSERSGNVAADLAPNRHSAILGGRIGQIGAVGWPLPFAREVHAGISSDGDAVSGVAADRIGGDIRLGISVHDNAGPGIELDAVADNPRG